MIAKGVNQFLPITTAIHPTKNISIDRDMSRLVLSDAQWLTMRNRKSFFLFHSTLCTHVRDIQG